MEGTTSTGELMGQGFLHHQGFLVGQEVSWGEYDVEKFTGAAEVDARQAERVFSGVPFGLRERILRVCVFLLFLEGTSRLNDLLLGTCRGKTSQGTKHSWACCGDWTRNSLKWL